MTTAPVKDQRRLLDLQALDTRAAKLAHQRRTLPVLATLAELEGRAEDLHRAQVEAKTVAADTRRELAKAEADVEQVRSRAARHQAQLDAGTGLSRELVALQTELAQLAQRQAVLEEIQLEVMERLEDAEARVAELQRQEDAISADVARHTAERDAQLAEIDAELENVRAERAALAGQVDAELLDLYEYARGRTGGLGAVALRGHRTEGAQVEFTLSELAAIDAAAPEEVITSEERGFILVRLDEGQ
ncbi:zinc ribbon domain-containing protein [Georgenia sp. AZ-5]|uniref:zinc ribbon domain-containing protein n=1 Tax=Georgenia sp. AZ-5 TaxID=3367526 RepID=UPI003754B447